MKLCVFFMLLTCIQVSASVHAQNVTLHTKDASVSQVLESIKKQTGYNYLWDDNTGSALKITVNVTATTLASALTACFQNQPIVYKIVDNTILVSYSPTKAKPFKPELKILPSSQYQLHGSVKDTTGQGLVGVSLRVKGTTRGGQTDVSGNFSIDVNNGETLVVSYIGYESAEIKIDGQQSLAIVLKESKNQLNAVVVTALNIKRTNKSLTYNVQQIAGSEVNTIKDGNFVNQLDGKVAGATINTSSTGLGGSARVVLRGTKSIGNLKNQALYVIDGIPMFNNNAAGNVLDVFSGANSTGDGISQLNPDDIESISVLTGPAAAALYGSNAAAGVILVTTKKGKAGKTSISLSNNTSFTSPFVLPQFQNTYSSIPGTYSSWGPKLTTPSSYKPADFFQTGTFISNSISLSTGTEKNQTYISASNANGTGIIPNNTLNRLNLTLRNTSKYLNDKLTVDLSANYIKESDQNMVSQGLYNNPLVPVYLFPVSDDITKYQVYERYNASRNFKTQFWPYGDQGLSMQNPYWIANRDLNTHATQRYMLNGSARYDFTPWLNVTARVKRDNSNIVGEQKYYASTYTVLTQGSDDGYYGRNVTLVNQTYADVIANITLKYKTLAANIFIGGSYDDHQTNLSGFSGPLNLIPNVFVYPNINLPSAAPLQNIFHQQNQAIFATLQLDYKKYIYLDASVRNDWNSALAGTTNTSILYPSVGLSTILTDAFNIRSRALSFLKIRGSFSIVGTPPDPYRGTFAGYPFGTGSISTLTQYPNATLSPEKTHSYEAGFNSKFLDNIISFDFTAYKSSTYNQIFFATTAASTGTSGQYVNAGQIDNKGIEASLNANASFGKFNWQPGVVFSLNRNKIVKLYQDKPLNEGGTTSYQQILYPGGSMGDIYVNTLETDEHGYIVVDPRTRTVTSENNTFVLAGNADPRFNIGLNNQFSYGDFSMSFLVSARIGGVGVSITQAEMDRFGVSEASAKARDAGGVSINGGLIPAQPYYNVVGGGTTAVGSQYVYSATNVRLGQAVISYKVPSRYFNNKIKGATLSLTGSNLFMFYNKAPFDPESTASTGTFYQGIDYFRQPSYRSVGFNVAVQF